MEHLDLAISREQEAVYSSNDEGGNPIMSERVSSLAAAIYGEFEILIQKYGQGVLDTLMPMVVNVLEQLDSTFSEMNEQTLELEMLSEDNEQLITQYEREKQLRKLAESKYLEYEDVQDQEKRNLQGEIEALELQHRQQESRMKSLLDQIERTEERLSESKKDYSALHTRHTEMIHMYMERMEHYNRMTSNYLDASPSARKKLHHDEEENKLEVSQGPSVAVAKSGHKVIETPETCEPLGELGEKRNDLSFDYESEKEKQEREAKNEKKETTQGNLEQETVLSETRNQEVQAQSSPKHDALSRSLANESVAQLTDNENIDVLEPNIHETGKASVIEPTSSDIEKSIESEIHSYLKDISPIRKSKLEADHLSLSSTEASKHNLSIEELMASQLSLDSSRLGHLQEQRRLTGPSLPSTVEVQSSVNDLSLFAELSEEEPGLLGEAHSTFLSPVGKELEGLIKENEELLDSKTKLQGQKNDLLQRIEEISREKEILEEQVSDLTSTKAKLKSHSIEVEQELKRTKHELEKATIAVKGKNGEDRMSSANRKRFTRVEMARVLMERNQYKERLMELQEAVRWTEMIRASKENHLAALQQKKKSSVWKFFNNLFAGSSGGPQPTPKRVESGPANAWYGAGQSPSSQHRRSNSVLGPTTPVVECITEKQRRERKERYKYVKEHINTEGRKHAYGWSLPANYSNDQEGIVSVPIPVYCRPLNTDPAMKIWCCAGVSTEGGRRSDGSFINLKPEFKEPPPSTVWIGTSTHSCSKVTILDANTPSNAIDQFIVCSSHLLCMTAVPGLRDSDFDIEDGFNGQYTKQPLRKHSDRMQKARPPIGPRSYSYGSGAEMRTAQPRKSGSQDFSLLDAADTSDVTGSLTGVQAEEEFFPEEDTVDGSTPKVTSALPTMWLGAQSGKIYVHSTIVNWKKCLQSGKLRDSVLSIVEVRGRVLVALADGTVAIFHRKPDGRWDLSNYHLLDLGRPHHSIRCMTVVNENVWCGYRNKVQVINPKSMSIEKSFDAHPRRESQVRQLACLGDGVWVSIRLDSTLRLYNAKTYHHLQDVDIEPYVSKMLGTGNFGYSFVRITALLLCVDRLWVGTGNGVILSIPLVAAKSSSSGQASKESSPSHSQVAKVGFMPYCSMVHTQLSFHGHRDSVKFFVAVRGAVSNLASAKAYTMAGATPPSPSGRAPKLDTENAEASVEPTLIMSGGEGYIDFRVGDDDADDSKGPEDGIPLSSRTAAAERSHLLVWQMKN